jgi:hypothetical protein
MTAEGKPQTGREHEVGTLTAPLLTLDLNREIEQLPSEGAHVDFARGQVRPSLSVDAGAGVIFIGETFERCLC